MVVGIGQIARDHNRSTRSNVRRSDMASYSVNKKAVARARQLIDGRQYVLVGAGDTLYAFTVNP